MFEPFAVGEGLDGHLEAAALADELEDGGVDPVDDRALELARSTIRRVLADVGSARPMDLSWMITVCLPLHRPKAEPAPMVERRGRSRDARSAGLPLPPGQVRSPNTPRRVVRALALPGGVGRQVARGPDRPGLPGARQRGQRRRSADFAVAAEADAVAEAQVPAAEAEQGDPVALPALQGGAWDGDVVPPERREARASALREQRPRMAVDVAVEAHDHARGRIADVHVDGDLAHAARCPGGRRERL